MTVTNTVYLVAQDLLDVVVDAYANEFASDSAFQLPTRRYVSDGGEVAHDCELVSVALGRVYRGTPNTPFDLGIPQRCTGIRTAEYHVWIVRCASTPEEGGEAPSTDYIESKAEPMMTDAWFLPYAIAEAIGDPLPLCDSMFIGDLSVFGPQGGFVGVDLIVSHQLG